MSKISSAQLLIVFSILFSACTDATQISFFCEKDKKDNYIIKWEVFPEKNEQAKIDIFSSDNDSVFSKTPFFSTLINEYITVIPPKDHIFREFFRLRVDQSYSGIISNRFFNNKGVQNLRDIGGYFTKNEKQVKWGKLYRSGDLANLSPEDIKILNNLNIRTVIDFRRDVQMEEHPDNLPANISYLKIPIEVNCFNLQVKERILEGYFLKGDAIIYTQDCYRTIIEKHSAEYAHFFDILCNESNYPILFHCGWGKDRSGLAAYFILKTLDVLPASIEEDYLYSNQGLDKKRILENAEDLPESVQEAITMISTADISHLRYAISCMKKKSGSVDEYMHKELKLTPQKIAKLKDLLLYNN